MDNYHDIKGWPLDELRNLLGWTDNPTIGDLTAVCMVLLDRVHRLEVEAKRERNRPDPLGEALNSGDGTYRP